MAPGELTGCPPGEVWSNADLAAMASRVNALELRVAELSHLQWGSKGLTIIVFSGDLDKLIAAFTLATGAVAMGVQVSMFFTFWGLAAIKERATYKGKILADKILTAMTPCGPDRLPLSKWEMLGLGRRFLGRVMAGRHMARLADLISLAHDLNIRMIACQASMDVMAVTIGELREGIEVGGVATALDAALESGPTVFI